MESNINRINCILKILVESNQTFFKAKSEEDFLTDICRIIIASGDCALAWITSTNNREKNSLKQVAHYSADIKYNILSKEIFSKNGFWYTDLCNKIKSNEFFVSNNLSAETPSNSFFEEAVKLGCYSFIALPIKNTDDIFGCLAIFSADANSFGEEIVKLFLELTENISNGIVSIRNQRRRECALKILNENEEHFKLIAHASNEIMYKYRYDTMQYDYISPTIKNLTGYTSEEINAKTFDSLVAEMNNYRVEELNAANRAIHDEEAKEWSADYLIWTKTGEKKWLSDHSYPWYNEDGELIGSIGILSDITEKKKVEKELNYAAEAAEELKRLKENILSNLSHELITPMAVIMGYSEILKNELKEPASKEMAEIIYQSGTGMVETLNLLLDLARLESETVDFELCKIDIVKIINEVIKSFSEQARIKKIFLNVISKFNSLTVISNERMLKSIISNLVSNAVKFTSVGGVSLILNKESDENNNNIVVKIADTGIGISQEQQKIIWEEFRQGSEGLNRRYGGIGLGLSITKKFVEKLNGSISSESEVNKGTTIIVKLPQLAETSDRKMVGVKKGEDVKQLPKVLVVDDDESSRVVMYIFLSGLFNCDDARNAEEAIAKTQNNKYDVILMDINLGKDKTGVEVAKQIREIEGYNKIPIVAVSAFSIQGDIEEIFNSGCTHYISKPFQKTEFVPFIQKVLNINNTN